jgi:PAS domain S-box-containing protein
MSKLNTFESEEMERLRAELEEAHETLRALKFGEVDALVVTDPEGEKIVTLLGAEKLARSIFEQSAEAIVVCDVDGTILKASEAAHEMCGTNPLLQSFNKIFNLIPLNDSERATRFNLSDVLAGQTVKGIHADYVSYCGRAWTLQVSAAPLRTSAEEVQGCVVMLTDITAQKKCEREQAEILMREREARQQLELANRMKDEFLGVVSHELRTPLMAILGWAKMLESGKLPPDKVQTGIRTIERNAQAQTRMVEELLDISRIVSGKLHLDISLVDMALVVYHVIEAVRPAAEAKNIKIDFQHDNTSLVVNGDPHRLQQVIWNLAVNAVKFTRKGGRIQFTASRKNSDIEICVSDNGPGISPEFLPHVFERFKQADTSLSRHNSGMGLGLAIVRHIMELHGGTVSAYSEGLGKGAAFTVRMSAAPLAKTGLPPVADTPHAPKVKIPEAESLRGCKVLVVDDDTDARNFLAELVQQFGGQAFPAQSADEALQILKRERPNVLLSDIGLPGTNGFELMRQIRKSSIFPNIPAIALTAHVKVDDALDAIASGFNLHLAKPIDPITLVNTLTALYQRSQQNC